ncbi:MAG: TetR/AcrR family transcriptional regulator [Clostridia bacterium]|nr:TetR/AcrR family transcriptional regulator [Clostridia bacterium]MEE1077149.1 TetR/AcrR family transcriptional regulator [Acutalibacteraceae bacterium]MEE1153659.1 TetR/AcrR family transcriptional regulator [Acutalibacteraceae bacterium]MEE1281799.1 TetR/AcrR family transcriptional regulator [Acutalibacteraceae bacterium]
MNNKFFTLPIEKQRRIINAAYKVFSENSYKKAPMSEIAEEGNISKSLLFHYFTNKKDLYMYLWDNACEITTQAIREYKTLDTDDFFEMLRRTLLSKCSVMRDYPYMYAFSLRAYYETAPEIKDSIQENFNVASKESEMLVIEKIDKSKLRKDIDIKTMYTEILYAVDGYMLQKYRMNRIIPDEIERETGALINFWEKVYTQQ